MANPVLQVRTMHRYRADGAGAPIYRQCVVYCPGCDLQHCFTIEVLDHDWKRPDGSAQPVWGWDGNEESPTFEPSMLAYSTVHFCEGEHEIHVCEEAQANGGGFGHCEHHGHGYAWRFPDGSMRRFKVYDAKPDEAEVVVTGGQSPHPRDPAWGNCHSFLRAGVWEFLGDSAHKLAGQRVPMVPLPDWYYRTEGGE